MHSTPFSITFFSRDAFIFRGSWTPDDTHAFDASERAWKVPTCYLFREFATAKHIAFLVHLSNSLSSRLLEMISRHVPRNWKKGMCENSWIAPCAADGIRTCLTISTFMTGLEHIPIYDTIPKLHNIPEPDGHPTSHFHRGTVLVCGN